jgi:Fe-S cluster assembly protein SufD
MTSNNVAGALDERAPDAVVPDVSKGERFRSFDVEAFEVPGGREEDWRFTPMKRLRGLHDGSAVASGKTLVELSTVDGAAAETVDRGDSRLGEAGTPGDRIAAQAFSSFDQATIVTVAKETKLAEPLVITVTGPGEDKVAYGHLQIRAERFAEATVVVDHRGSGVYADNVEFIAGDGAKLDVVVIADWSDDAAHVSAQHIKLGRDASFKHTVVTLGGDLVRLTPTVTFSEPGATVELDGLYFADEGQHQEHRLFVDHAVPHCKSNVVYKGALQGNGAHTVWIGDVLIRAAAESTETFELNRNLVLTEGARADSVPNLEIETGEIVSAGHASATGRFDDEQLFYLQARGIPVEQARRLVVRGFFHELLMKIAVPEVRERLERAIEVELEAVGV